MRGFIKGDKVVTDFSGKKTAHTVTDIDYTPPTACQSGTVIRVTPTVPKAEDGAWFDIAWFEHSPN